MGTVVSTVLSPTPPIAGEPHLAERQARRDARRGGPRRASSAAAHASHTLRRTARLALRHQTEAELIANLARARPIAVA